MKKTGSFVRLSAWMGAPLAVLCASGCLVAGSASAAEFFFDDFEGYANDGDMNATWQVASVESTPGALTEWDTAWTVENNPTARPNPPTLDGTPTTGNFLLSDSDYGGDPDFGFVENQGPDTGVSYDAATPSFSTAGAAGNVWLHADVSALLNDRIFTVFMVDVSTDGGNSWATKYEGISSQREAQGATTFLPDFDNAGGYFGRLDVDLGPVGDQDDVQVRFRHYEPQYAWWVAVDNVRVDDVPAISGGTETIFSEDFDSYTLGTMTADGLNAGTLDGWTTRDGEKGNRYTPDELTRRGVNRLMHTAPEGSSGEVQFAILDSDADPDPDQDEYLMTPALDLTEMDEVFLHFDDEAFFNGTMEVLAMQDANQDGPDSGDPVLDTVFAYSTGALVVGGGPMYAHRVFDVTDVAAGKDNVFFAWRLQGSDEWWWAIDNVAVTGNSTTTPLLGDLNLDGMVNGLDVDPFVDTLVGGSFQDEADMNQDGVVNGLDVDPFVAAIVGGGMASVPEPSTLALALGLAVCFAGWSGAFRRN